VAKRLAIGAAGLLLVLVAVVWWAGRGGFGSHEGPGRIAGPAVADASLDAREAQVLDAAREIGAPRPKQVLFGDLHVHTTFSFDAFLISLPVAGGEGAHPPADACDFARWCSGLDFWSINDHAFSITPRHWSETVESIRQCNEVAGDPARPDLVSFLGWEWTQVGTTPEDHYGHKNVVLAHTGPEQIPARPIAALRSGLLEGATGPLRMGLLALAGGGRVHDLARYFAELGGVPRCDPDAHVRDLPPDCMEDAGTPADLFRKLDEWGHDSLVIPHGTTWGFYSPPGSSWDKQLSGAMHDADRQTLFEIYSGHGDSEVYRSFRAVEPGPDGEPRCPEPTDDYLPTCWRAGEIIRERCAAEGGDSAECERRAERTRAFAAAAGVAAHLTVPGARPEEWLDAGQCRDCSEPAFNYRPAGSAQYVTALGDFAEDPEDPRRFRFGFLSSSDNHYARPGTGYKEVHRRGMTESRGGASDGAGSAFLGDRDEEPASRPRPFDVEQPGFDVFELERQASFFYTGGLAAVHAEGRSREAVWEALRRREVYGTTGPRILLWFDLLNPPGSRGRTTPMGGEVAMDDAPVFQVRAVGSFEQRPGCPEASREALGAERLERLCLGECHHPGDVRRPITRIEVVRIRPQVRPDEDVADLVDDPWRVFECEPSPLGCAATFVDTEFAGLGRDAVYYARVFEAPAPAINADNLRCERDASGACIDVDLCPGPEGPADDCLGRHEPRAWSSPIYVDHAAGS